MQLPILYTTRRNGRIRRCWICAGVIIFFLTNKTVIKKYYILDIHKKKSYEENKKIDGDISPIARGAARVSRSDPRYIHYSFDYLCAHIIRRRPVHKQCNCILTHTRVRVYT